uniref:Uncharacterized protein n=1 Tax=Nelumbo nucifera TaxID=4432 RepID=A0A822YBN6_NELNU|nr:TPA_asm: hypothetical protein HUJ06_030399 [Nelumbo nucifera]
MQGEITSQNLGCRVSPNRCDPNEKRNLCDESEKETSRARELVSQPSTTPLQRLELLEQSLLLRRRQGVTTFTEIALPLSTLAYCCSSNHFQECENSFSSFVPTIALNSFDPPANFVLTVLFSLCADSLDDVVASFWNSFVPQYSLFSLLLLSSLPS